MRRFMLGVPDHDGVQHILRKSRGGAHTSFGEVRRQQAGDVVAYSWQEHGSDTDYGGFDTPEEALADYVQHRKDRTASRPKGTPV